MEVLIKHFMIKYLSPSVNASVSADREFQSLLVRSSSQASVSRSIFPLLTGVIAVQASLDPSLVLYSAKSVEVIQISYLPY
jgi:hypothetical protein